MGDAAWNGASGGAALATSVSIAMTVLASDPATIEMSRIAALNLGLTQFKRIPIGPLPQGTTTAPTANDGAVAGGGRKSSGGVDFFGSSLFPQVLTRPGAISFYAKINGPTAAKVAEVALANGGANHIVSFMTDFATNTTKYILKTIGAATTASSNQTIVADSQFHWFRLTWDTLTIRGYVDNVLAVSMALVNVIDEPFYPIIFSTTAGDIVLSDIVFGY